MGNPSKIIEGAVTYSLGELQGQRVDYDFKKILIYLEAKGRLLFGKSFTIYEEDREVLYKLCNYAIRDFGMCRKLGIDPNKGLLLSGPVGCGKTSLMKLLRYLTPHFKPYEVIPARNIAFAFNHIGYRIIEDYGDGRFYCFDDLGVEPMGRHFGKDCNVMGEILLSRYELFLKTGIRTHATTNLNAEELQERYGPRVRSRMRQQFNLVAFGKETKDKRT
ncbi:ATPase [Croceitalea sp. MTPC9]|uniref:ATPase n=1 Tax=unclassified Croceitalea TaxID=2632280 RepID=UPI002B3D46BC|nr:ATPase [Croceitalea sp. MTPC6]GMN16124.1 ATPase [Croceitalea sp. MTPC9]